MQTLGSTITAREANSYFESILPEIEKAIVFRLRTVPLTRGRNGARPGFTPANDNACPMPPLPPGAHRAGGTPEATNDQPGLRSPDSSEEREVPIRFRTARSSEVRASLLADSDLRSDILFAVYQDFTRVVAKGVFKGPQDRALVFQIVHFQTIKVMRPRAKVLLRTVFTKDGSSAVDHLVDQESRIEVTDIDQHRAHLKLRPVVDGLAEEDQLLLAAKLNGTLAEYARRRGEKPVTVRCRAKRLHDHIVRLMREESGSEECAAA